MKPMIPKWLPQNSWQPLVDFRCSARRRTLLEDLGHLASKLFGRPVQRTRSVQHAGECSLFLNSHLANRAALQVCAKRFQVPAAEFVVQIAQDLNRVIAGVHSVAFRVPIGYDSQLEHPGSKNIPLGRAFLCLLKHTVTP